MNIACGFRSKHSNALLVAFTLVLYTISAGNLSAAPIAITYNDISITHNSGIFVPEIESTLNGGGATTVSMPFHNDSNGTDFSGGGGATSSLFNPGFLGLSLAGGTGISQFDPAPNFGPSSLVLDYEITFEFDAAGFPLPNYHMAYVPLVSYAGIGDVVSFEADFTFFSSVLNQNIGPGISVDFVNAGRGFVAETLVQFDLAALAIPPNDFITMEGTITFTADNHNQEAYIRIAKGGGGINFPVPAPAPLIMISLGLLGLSLVRRKG